MFLEPLDARRVMAFSPFSDYAVGPSAAVLVAGDFTGDGQADLVVSNNTGMQLMRGNANGSFQAPTAISSTYANSAVAGDLNGDGKLDLATNSQIFLGSGNGTFQSPTAINLPPQIPTGYSAPVAQQPTSVAVGDLNDDGKLDLVVTGRSTISVNNVYYIPGYGYYSNFNTYTSGQVNVLLGNGDGTMGNAAVTNFPQQGQIGEALAVVDLNHDSVLDLVVTSASGSMTSSAFLGSGNGPFAAPNDFSTGNGAASVLTGDFDEDGSLDLVTRSYSSGFMLNKGRGDGTFDNPTQITPDQSGLPPRSVAVGDINADGHLDIAFTTQRVEVTQYLPGYWGYYPSDGITHDAAKVILRSGAGTFSAPVSNDLGAHSGLYAELYSSLLEDFNHDGLLDLAAADRQLGLLTVALNDGSWNPPAAASVADVSITEGDSGQTNAVITVTLTGDHNSVSLDYLTSDYTAIAGSDYSARSGTLTFAPGVFSQTIVVPITGDRLGEGTESFYITLSNANGAIFADNQAIVTILDNEPTINIDHAYWIDPLTVVEGNSGTTPAVFTVTLSQPYDQEVTVHYYTLTGNVDDIIALDGTLHFAPGQTSQTITVQVVGDLIHEDLEAFNVYLDTPSANASIVSSAGYCYIEDNDPLPTVSIGDVSKNEGNSGTTKFTFTLTLSAPAGNGVYANFATSNGTATTANQDYVAKLGYVYFDPGKTTATISIDVKGDKSKEANETFYVDLNSAGGATIADDRGVGTIVNDDGGVPSPTPPKISIGDASIAEGNSSTKLLVFTVSLSQSSSKEVRVNFATANGTAQTGDNDYESESGTLRFAPGETTKTISIIVNGDKKLEQNETFKVKLSSAVNGEIADTQGLGTIVNDDVGGASSKRHHSARAFDAALADWLSGSASKRRK
jgi:hypothetical protein